MACAARGPVDGIFREGTQSPLLAHRGHYPQQRSVDQLAHAYAESHRDFVDGGEGGALHRPLDLGDVGAVKAGAIAQFFLGPASLAPKPSHVGGEALTDLHTPERAQGKTIDLQPKSLIST